MHGIRRKSMKKKFVLVAIIIVVVVGAVLVGNGLLSNISKPSTKQSANDYSWEELSKISSIISEASSETEAIDIARKYNLVNKNGELDGTQSKNITLSDGTVAQVQIVGVWHDVKSDGSGKAGLTFIFCSPIASMGMNPSATNVGGWSSSQIRSWLANEGMSLLPKELTSHICSVLKRTNNVGETRNVSSISTTSDSLWLFSAVELYGTPSYSNVYIDIMVKQGKEYLLFQNKETNIGQSNPVLEKIFNGTASSWWIRSPFPSTLDSFRCVSQDGKGADVVANSSLGVCPGFCL